MRLLAEVCEGLAQLHSMGWVHGDLKPGNVLITRGGSARLSDFGLAVELSDGTHGYTAPVGTPDCLPPERWRAPLAERGIRCGRPRTCGPFGILVQPGVHRRGLAPSPARRHAARAAAVQEYAEGRAALRLDPAVPPFWRELAADCLAPDARSAPGAPGRRAAGPHPGGEARRPPPRGALPAAGARGGRRGGPFAVCGALGGWLAYGQDGASERGGGGAPAAPPSAAPASVRVYNAEAHCRGRTDRDRLCSLGLAIDPAKAYTLDNVVPTRVWHGDVLAASCRFRRGSRSPTRRGPARWPGTGCGSRPAGARRGCRPCGPRTGPPSRTARRTRAPRPPGAEPCRRAVSRAGCRGRRCPSPRRRPTA